MSQEPIERHSRARSPLSDEDRRVICAFAERNGISVDQARQVANILRRHVPIRAGQSAAESRTPAFERVLSA